MNVLNQIKQLASKQHNQVVAWRRHIHQYPELSFMETNTQAYVAEQLRSLGITEITYTAQTGITALIRGNNPESKTIALRADMDALPIEEQNNTEYVSKNKGVMHACGHDVHTASLLGAASILQQLRHEFNGTVKLLFQPGEEKLPGGASLMIADGALENPKPQTILGQHVMPLLPAGTIGFREGLYMASTDELYVTITGKGGHGAMPHLTVDPVLIAAHLITTLQSIVSRNANPIVPSVLSFGKVIANGATNIIPDQVYLEGTFRTLDETWRTKAHELLLRTAEQLAASMGGSCSFEIRKGYPFLRNDIETTRKAKAAAIAYVGETNVVDLDIWMAAEDFAYYSQEMPACFYRLGTRNEAKGIVSGVHTPTFDIDESALELSTGLMAWLTIQSLHDH
ncbi:MAG: M20 family metallopeptidase [Bacteroidia bacterium]|jgi:amidohydrolase|nr:M20 family metallopeptidase [Bacteroidia bacterium]